MAAERRIAMPVPVKRSPPLAFQPTSNDALGPPRDHHSPSTFTNFQSPDYLNSPAARHKPDYDVASPMEQDLQSQVIKQAEALRLQHQAFVVERECWEMERERLHKRITSLECLLKSPTGHSPARSPIITPFAIAGSALHGNAINHRGSSNSTTSRLPSIAENDSPEPRRMVRDGFFKRETAPAHIDLPVQTTAGDIDGADEAAQVPEILAEELPASPPVSRQILSPPPASYVKNAGHTPLRMPSRPTSSSSERRSSVFSEHLEDTPTRQNTHRNLSIEVDEDIGLTGPLRLPELPSRPGVECFTIEALTARLQHIEQHPDENEPFALSARANRDVSSSDVDTSEVTIKALTHDTNGEDLSKVVSLETGDETSPPPASETSQAFSLEEAHETKGIKLKKKPSINFGAPLGQLRR